MRKAGQSLGNFSNPPPLFPEPNQRAEPPDPQSKQVCVLWRALNGRCPTSITSHIFSSHKTKAGMKKIKRTLGFSLLGFQ